MSKPAIGINFGTTNFRVAICRHGKVEIIANEQGSRTTPSYVAFTSQEKLIGDAARRQAGTNPKNTIFDLKRLLDRKFNDNFLLEDMKKWAFDVIDDYGQPKIKVDYMDETKLYDPEEIYAMIIEKMAKIVENFLGNAIEDVVITVPAYFNDVKRQAVKEAGEMAGLNVLQIMDEPTAAAIAYSIENNVRSKKEKSHFMENGEDENILVFDMGGGTLDVTILTMANGQYEVKSTSGESHLGGDDFDNRIVNNCIHQIQIKHKIDISTHVIAVNRLRTICEKAKRALSTSQQVSIDVEFILEGSSFPQDFHTLLHRKKFEALNEDIFRKMMKPVKKALAEANVKTNEIHYLILAGGSTRIPKISQILRDYFKTAIVKSEINPDEVVAYGASIRASNLIGEDSEQLQEKYFMDMLPLSLGIETTGGMMSIIIPRNTTVPITKTKIFTTHKDNQTKVIVQVYEGERPLTKDNKFLGGFRLTGIKESRAGQAEIIVQFNMDTNGMLTVSATEKSGETEQSLDIAVEGLLTTQEITEKIQLARESRFADEIERRRVQAQVTLESLCLRFQSEFTSSKAKEAIDMHQREEMFSILAKTLSWLDINYKSSKEEYEIKYREVHDKCDPIRRKMYDASADCYEADENSACSFGEID